MEKSGGTPDFSSWNMNGISIGTFLTSLVSFVIMAAVVYFGIVTPYTKAKEFFARGEKQEAEAGPSQEELLAEIRDLLKAQKQA